MEFVDILSWVCLVAGAFFIFTGAVGLLRMPDFFTRLHPAGMNDSAGLTLVLIALALHSGFGVLTAKIILLMFFLMITSSTASHALAKAAIHSGVKPMQGKIKKATKRKKNG